MATQTITFEVSERLFQSIRRVAAVTRQPLESIVRESLEHALPPLDDLPDEEASALASLSSLDDADLWREARATLGKDAEAALTSLLERQGAQALSAEEEEQLQSVLNAYGRLTVRKAHAWLLLARRGYRVPPQGPDEE